jgi:hypothetical protein
VLRTIARPFTWSFGRFINSRKRRHITVAVTGALLAAGGLLAYGLVSPEVPFVEAPLTPVGEVHADKTVKVYGRVVCDCTTAIDREETQVGATGRTWNATYEPFSVSDPSGDLHVDTTSITRLTPGPSGGDWKNGDWITVYGTVYDQGHGALALRAEMIAKAPDDTPAVNALLFEVLAAVGLVAIAYVFTDRWLFGGTDA